MSDKFQFIKDASEISLLRQRDNVYRSNDERFVSDLIQDSLENPNDWQWENDNVSEIIKNYRLKKNSELSSLHIDTFDDLDTDIRHLLPDEDNQISAKEKHYLSEFLSVLDSLYDLSEQTFDYQQTDDFEYNREQTLKLFSDCQFKIDMLYKNADSEFKQNYYQILDKFALFNAKQALENAEKIQKQVIVLDELYENVDYSFWHTRDIYNANKELIDTNFPKIKEKIAEFISEKSASDIFVLVSDSQIRNIYENNPNFRKWFNIYNTGENEIAMQLVMSGNLPRLFYRGLDFWGDKQEIKTQGIDGEYKGDFFTNKPQVAATYIDISQNPLILSGFLRPNANPFVVPCDIFNSGSSANWNNVLEHYNIYQAICLFDMAGFDNEIMQGDWQNAFGNKKVVDYESIYYTDAERDDDGEWTKPVKVFKFFDLDSKTGNL
ncbi:MAG: hypothetical protein IKG79_00510, partial [Neisseriaceae bacterium]|nr:hypothetical protein [Neisseriaceae bacterium]